MLSFPLCWTGQRRRAEGGPGPEVLDREPGGRDLLESPAGPHEPGVGLLQVQV